jgi:tetratricopeptide (TPR) repeat protein
LDYEILCGIGQANRTPMDPTPIFRLASLYLQRGNMPLAAVHFSAVLDRVPVLDGDRECGARGNVCMALGLHEQAIKWYTEALRLNPGARGYVDSMAHAARMRTGETNTHTTINGNDQ